MDTRPVKGTRGYLNQNKIQAWKRAALMLSVPVAIFLASWVIHGTRENVMTVVAIVGCLPGCNQVVRAVMASRYHSMEKKLWDCTEEARGELPVLYENVFTSYEVNYYVDCIVVAGRDVVGYSSDSSLDAAKAAEHIRKMLKNSSYKQNVKILKEQKAFLERVRSLAAGAPENVPFQGDDRYPGFTRDEIVLHLLKAISL